MSCSPQPPAGPKIRAVLFDLGNTLIYLDVTVERLNELRVRHLHSVLPAMGISVQFEEFQEKLAQLWERSFSEAERTEKEYPATHVFAEIARNLGVTEETLTPKFLGRWEREYFGAGVPHWKPFPEARTTLSLLRSRGYKLGLVSNVSSDWVVRQIMDRLSFTELFEVAVTSARIGMRKPNSKIFSAALRSLGVEAEEAVVVGDSLSQDILGAKRLGMKAIHVRRDGDEAGDIKPNAVVTNIAAVPKVLDGWSR